jgi:hypothetical protein
MPETSSATWPALVAGAKAKASDVEAKFDWLEGSLWPQAAGNTTDGAFDLGAFGKTWRGAWVNSLNPTTTAGGVAMFTTAVANASVGFEIAGTTKALLLSRLTTAQRNALTAVNGMMVYDSDIGSGYVYENGAWQTMGQKIGIIAKTSAAYVVSGASTTTMTILDISGSGRLLGVALDVGDDQASFGEIYVVADSVASGALPGPTTGAGSFRLELDERATTTTFKVGNYAASLASIMMPTPFFFKSQLKVYVRGTTAGVSMTAYAIVEKS